MPPADELELITYADFGRRFFEVAVTRERVVGVTQSIAGRPIDVGPIGVGPIGLIKVRANGAVGEPAVADRPDDAHVGFDILLPVDLVMHIEIGLDTYRFDAKVRVRLVLTARAAERLKVVIDILPPSRGDVDVDVTADGLRASVLQIVANVDGEIKRQVAKFVRRELDKPEVQQARIIDVEAALAKLVLPGA